MRRERQKQGYVKHVSECQERVQKIAKNGWYFQILLFSNNGWSEDAAFGS